MKHPVMIRKLYAVRHAESSPMFLLFFANISALSIFGKSACNLYLSCIMQILNIFLQLSWSIAMKKRDSLGKFSLQEECENITFCLFKCAFRIFSYAFKFHNIIHNP